MKTVDLTLSYLNDEGDPIEYTRTVPYASLARVIVMVDSLADEVEEPCTHPNGIGRTGCPCGALSPEED